MRTVRMIGGHGLGLAALVFLVATLVSATGQPARAAESDAAVAGSGPVSVGPAAIVRIVAARGILTVRTWDRPFVQVANGSGVDVRRSVVTIHEAQSLVPILAGRVDGPRGAVILPEDTFAVSSLTEGAHDVVTIRADEAPATVDVPQNAGLVTVVMESGAAVLRNYHGSGAFVARVRTGTVRLIDVTGEGFVQVMRGPIVARRSSFARLRVRSGTGNVAFERCHAKQIEVSSIDGSIVYDNGSFEPGLARFESQHGDVAIGVNGASNLGGRASGGHVYTMFDRAAQVDAKDAEATAVTAGGGPVVNASSGSGNVFLYDGALRTRTHVPVEWNAAQAALRRVLQRRAERANAAVADPPAPHAPAPPASTPARAPATAAPHRSEAAAHPARERNRRRSNAPHAAARGSYRKPGVSGVEISRARSSVQPSFAA